MKVTEDNATVTGISLLIPCKNAAGYLPRLFEGVRAQSRPFAEIICYDDNSTDATCEVAEGLGARVIKAEGPSTGPAKARNRLAMAASAPWIHFHDADGQNIGWVRVCAYGLEPDETIIDGSAVGPVADLSDKICALAWK